VPGKKAEKGYVLLRETLAATGRVGVARVVIRTREYLSAVMPQGDALLLMLLRYPQELVDPADYRVPTGKPRDYRITARELDMAKQLIDSMAGTWQPEEYRDEFRERLGKVIEKRLKTKGVVRRPEVAEAAAPENAATNVVDFMELLKESLATRKRTPAAKSGGGGAKRKTPARRGKTAKTRATRSARKSA
jgi:DNA end-binding protein Ku